jgi:hypothetical protein
VYYLDFSLVTCNSLSQAVTIKFNDEQDHRIHARTCSNIINFLGSFASKIVYFSHIEKNRRAIVWFGEKKTKPLFHN